MTNDEDAERTVITEEPMGAGESQAAEEKVYDMAERTARFGEAIIAFAKRVPRNVVTNYCEADDAVSKKDFRLRLVSDP
jgi:hypothetical protein